VLLAILFDFGAKGEARAVCSAVYVCYWQPFWLVEQRGRQGPFAVLFACAIVNSGALGEERRVNGRL